MGIGGTAPKEPTQTSPTVSSTNQATCPEDQVSTTSSPTSTSPTGVAPVVTAPVFIVYAGYFRISNATPVYQQLLENCRRCGTKRWIQGPYGTTEYQRLWTTSNALQRCENWLQSGFLQIEFSKKELPAQAKVLIQPKYTGTLTNYSWTGEQQEIWGEAFEVTVQAQPINKSQGFQIRINPIDGIEGNYPLILESNNNSPTNNSELQVSIKYGEHQQIISRPKLTEYQKKWLCKPKYTCKQYTN